MFIRFRQIIAIVFVCGAAAVPVTRADDKAIPVPQGTTTAQPATAAAAALDDRIQDVKGEVIRLNRDLMVLEEELLFPANTQIAVFVSMDVGKLFSLESLKVKLDDKDVTNYLYTPNEVQALHRGGVQRIYIGSLKAGEHQLA